MVEQKHLCNVPRLYASVVPFCVTVSCETDTSVPKRDVSLWKGPFFQGLEFGTVIAYMKKLKTLFSGGQIAGQGGEHIVSSD